MFEIANEGSVRIKVPKEKKISRKMAVFYNPVMAFNRDISVQLLNSVEKMDMQIALPLAGTGVRAVRFFKELDKGKIKRIYINDVSKRAVRLINSNLKLNSIKSRYETSNTEANKFLLDGEGFDYVDVDPFGSPNKFLNAAITKLSRNGILAVTATDTSSLAGTFPAACIRKYWAKPLRNEIMHETGLRILIRKVQLIGSQYEKAMLPIFSYFRDHYYRIFFLCEKGRRKVDKIMEKMSFVVDADNKIEYAGPLWAGQLWDKRLVGRMYRRYKTSFLKTINEEAKIKSVGFYELHSIAKKCNIKNIPKKDEIIEKIKKSSYKAAPTHFSGTGIRSSIGLNELIKILKAF